MHRLKLMLLHPWSTLKFLYTFSSQSLLIFLRRILLPHMPVCQSLRTQLQRAFMSSCSATFPDLCWGLPVGPLPENKARLISPDVAAYVIPGYKGLKPLCVDQPGNNRCVAVYAHGGGYARGEARMYRRYMERWVRAAAVAGLDLTFVSVEYPLTDEAPHPAQLNMFMKTYTHLLEQGVPSTNIIFMGDSAGGGLCVLSGLECIKRGLPQPAGSVLQSPWMDMSLRCHEGGNALIETDYVVTANKVCPMYAAKWLNGIPGDSKEVNPLYREPSEIAGLSPLLILVGAAEFALQDSKDLSILATKAGIKNKLVCEEGQLHIYALGSTWLDPDVRRRTDATIISWMQQCIGRADGS